MDRKDSKDGKRSKKMEVGDGDDEAESRELGYFCHLYHGTLGKEGEEWENRPRLEGNSRRFMFVDYIVIAIY